MISDKQLPELRQFKRIERSLPLRTDSGYANCVVPTGNDRLPVHRWVRFKESFSADFLRIVLSTLEPELGRAVSLLDPFCGVGTSLISAQELAADDYAVTAVGIELNPFIEFAARTKVRWPSIDAQEIEDSIDQILEAERDYPSQLPRTSSFTSETCISRHVAMSQERTGTPCCWVSQLPWNL
jgi:hypothetical protein